MIARPRASSCLAAALVVVAFFTWLGGARRELAPPSSSPPPLDDLAQVGFDAPFELALDPVAMPTSGRVTWRQIEGDKLRIAIPDEESARLRGWTLPLSASHPAPLPWGIVPLSPRTRGQYAFEATWTSGGDVKRHVVRVSSAARASGVPSLARGQRVLLGGAGWIVRERPRDGRAEVIARAGIATFEPDAVGRWVLSDAAGAALALRAGTQAR